MLNLNRLLIFSIILVVLFLLPSCKLAEATDPINKDTTPPLSSISVKDANEISGEASIDIYIDEDRKNIGKIKLYLDGDDIGIYSGDTESIIFDTSPYVNTIPGQEVVAKTTQNSDIIDSERTLHIEVTDNTGNIGKSNTLRVIITEYPGWRKYYKIDDTYILNCFLVDMNKLIWMGFSQNGVIVYDPRDGNTRSLTIPTNMNNNIINDFELNDGSRVWIASENHVSKYDYDADSWLELLTPPEDNSHVDGDGNPILLSNSVHAVALDNNNNLYIGTGNDDLFRYDGTDFTRFKIPGYRIFPMDIHPDGTIYYSTNWGPQSYMNNDVVYEYANYPGDGAEVVSLCQDILIDNTGNVWFDTGWTNQAGCYIWDGTIWNTLYSNDLTEKTYPVLCDENGMIYAELWSNDLKTNNGIATYDGTDWTYWKDLDTPFNLSLNGGTGIPSLGTEYSFERSIGESWNGDIWMVLDNTLWRYRPSLGGYP